VRLFISFLLLIAPLFSQINDQWVKDRAISLSATFVRFADTKSMVPLITKDTLGIAKFTSECGLNDIVIYHDGEKLISHRVIFDTGNSVLTKGDALFLPDRWKVKSAILYRVIELHEVYY
jgi:hypothetical protein